MDVHTRRKAAAATAEEARDDVESAPVKLAPEEDQKAREAEKLNAATTHEVLRREGIKDLNRAPSALAWSGIAAGLAMGLSLLTIATLRHHLPDAPWRPLVTALGYSIGFLAVTLGSQQLYTENTLRPIVPLLAARTSRMLRKAALLWLVVFAANLIGAMTFAVAAAHTEMFSPDLRAAMQEVAHDGMKHPWAGVFSGGIIAGWVIALMVWMIPAADSAKVVVVLIMTWLVGAGELSHVIVGAVEAFYLVALGQQSLVTAFASYIVPAFLGNTIGGVTLVAALNHAQVETA